MGKYKLNFIVNSVSMLTIVLSLTACSGGERGDAGTNPVVITPASSGSQYVVFAWNDLGMHCLNPSYDTAVILPPYNTVWAQVVKRGNPPQVMTTGLTVEYRMINNTSSVNKGKFGQFWTYVQQLFGVTLAPDTGLNLDTPTIHNGLSGTMVSKGDHFQVNGIPLTPINDSNVWNPFQVVEVTVKDGNGTIVAKTQATVPISDEINCAKCHLPTAANNNNPFLDILQKHDKLHNPPDGLLVPRQPILCAGCHGSPALGLNTPGDSGKYLSLAIHRAHATRLAPDGSPITCYDCHPGSITNCNRSLAHTASNENCTTCHGTMRNVAYSIISSGRIPWVNEPKCVTCHGSTIPEVDTGTTLYRNAIGHGGMYCAGCHGSPHAMVPSRQATDNYQALQYQNSAKTIGSCGACHAGSKGAGLGEFLGEHGSGGRSTACNICHTVITNANSTYWPHQYQWKNR